MRYSKKRIEASGFEPSKLKTKAEDFRNKDPEDPFRKWIEREAARIRDGVDRNLKNWRLWWALDQAYDAPFHQVSYTLLRDLLEKDYDSDKVKSLVEDFGLTHMMEPVLKPDGTPCCNGDGSAQKRLNIPVFFKIFVPLCAAYLKARWAKLFNDRNNIPLYKYEPAYSTKDNRLRCDIITSRIALMASQYGYANDEKDSIFQALHYGLSIAFPREAWHRDEQEDDKGEKWIVREGLRFNMPPPERLYYDMSERLSTLNSDSGLAYVGYWHISKLGDVKSNPDFWNKDKITFGNGVDVISASPNFFANIYPCTLKFPGQPSESVEAENDREKIYAAYTSAEDDTAVLLTEHFTTVIPKDVGAGSYEHPVKVRMVMANYDTPIYIEPIYCSPAAYYGYDAEGNRARNSSLTLEVMPFQDHIGNILTQWILAAKQNLISPVFVDTDIVDKSAIDAFKNEGEKLLRGRQFIEFSSNAMRAKIGDTRAAFYAPQFPLLPTSEMQTLIRGLLDLMERALQFSAQEIGQAASHEQSATESNIIQSNTSNRVRFTGTFIDDGQWAKKKMLYEAWMAHGDDDVDAEIHPSYTNTVEEFKELCKKLGIEIVDTAGGNQEKVILRADKGSLSVDSFVSPRDNENRINNPAVANAAVQLLSAFTNNPALLSAVGLEQVVSLTNTVADLLGLPKDFRLKYQPQQQGQPQEEMMQSIQQQIKQVLEQVAKRIEQGESKTAEAIKQTNDALHEGDNNVAQSLSQEVGKAMQDQQSQAVGAIKQLAERQQAAEQAIVQMQQLVQQTSPPSQQQ